MANQYVNRTQAENNGLKRKFVEVNDGTDTYYYEASLVTVAPGTGTEPDTGTTTSVADSATNVTLLAANASRYGATIYNDSTVVLYLKLGATASTTSFTAKMQPDDYYEVPYGYKGIIDGIWASDSTGSARITELT